MQTHYPIHSVSHPETKKRKELVLIPLIFFFLACFFFFFLIMISVYFNFYGFFVFCFFFVFFLGQALGYWEKRNEKTLRQ